MDIKTLKNFIVIAENGSICKAARELHLSQPPLSKQLKQLEEELHVQLFERSSRGVALTDQGRILYAHAISLVNYSDMIVRELSSGEQSPVRLGMITSSVHYAISLINDFFSDSDDMSFRFEITEKNSFELLDLLKHNLIDLAIIRTPFDTNRAFDYIKLTNDHLLAVGSSDFFQGSGRTVSLSELADLPLITVRRWREHIDTNISRLKRSPHYIFICDDNRTALSLALNGRGVAILPDSLVNNSYISSSFQKRLIEGEPFKTSIYAVYSNTRKFNQATTAFLEFILSKEISR